MRNRSLNAIATLTIALGLTVLTRAVPFRTAALRAEDAPKPPDAKAAPPKASAPKAPVNTAPAPALPAGQAKPAEAAKGPQAPGGASPVAKRVSEPQAVAIVDSYIKAIGGKEVLAKVKDRVTKFRNIKHSATGQTVANINLLIKEGVLIREEWDIEGFDIKGEKLAFVQIYNGRQEEGWVQMLGTVSPLDGRTLQVFVWDKQMDDFFCHWEEDGYTLSLAGQGIVPKDILQEPEDTPCDIVVVTDFSGRQQMRFFFSKKDSLLLKKEWQDAGTNPKALSKKEQYYKMYRDLAFMDNSGLSVKFPLKLEIYLDGDLDTERQYTNVRFNSALGDKLFDKPEGKPFVPVTGATSKEEKKAAPAPGATEGGSGPKVKVRTGHPGAAGPAATPPEKKAEADPKATTPEKPAAEKATTEKK